MQLFYTPEINSEIYTLNQEESKHCVKVLRLVEGAQLHLTNGLGKMFKAEVVEAHHKACKLKVIETISDFEKRNYYLHMAVAPTKNIDRFEWFLEKATEIGIDEITPIICEHSERKIIKPERLERVIVAAMKQSLKAFKPKLNKQTTFSEFISADFTNQQTLLAHCYERKKEALKSVCDVANKTTIMVGPEGDFSLDEVVAASDNGFKEISLGESRLRTETAGIVACHTVNLINQ